MSARLQQRHHTDKDSEDGHKRRRYADRAATSARRREQQSSDSEERVDLRRLGIDRISLDDTTTQARPFRRWLKRERDLYVDELSREDEAKYYRRFARRWNDGALSERYYRGSRQNSRSASPSRASSSKRKDSHSPDRIQRASSPEEVGPFLPASSSHRTSQSRSRDATRAGPSAPGHADLLLAREDASHASHQAYKSSLKASYSHANDLVPKGVGKEGKMEEKRATAAANKAFADKDADREAVVDESTLMGSGGGFAEAIRKRDAAKIKREQEREMQMREKREGDRERLEERKRKEEDTMAMFREMAKNRFG